ncbi:transcriptional regulatory protein pro-1 [Fusarium subglutinans]|uniref:Transcriptional regulatory protein pro-1 n=1 Tax=Gibberella subglutinans TaxID=42677 RepID=A0A8H5V298_GIBSU|nr:transcriptional regulatory protein pro-1 [Fusarium subglutinans]KAF5608267.1 transcriptional regulatory protein pro-1 [Fusarium subglutinans]
MARSRGGCLNCKARKRKCDQARPECHACSQRGMRCQGYSTPLRWVNGVASRGRFAGASVPDASLVANQGPESNQDLMSMDSETSSAPRHDTSSPASGSISSSAFSPQTIGVPSADAQDPRFQRFMNNGLNRLYSTEASSWIKPFFEQMAYQSPALVMIAGAIQLYMDDGNRGMSVKSMEYTDLALQTFRQELSARYERMHLATICAGLLVCSLCLLQTQPWTMYLELIVDVYDLKTKLSTVGQISNDLHTQHLLEVLGVMDLPSSVIGRVNPSIGVWKLFRRLQDDRDEGRATGVEVVSGIPRSLLDIFASIMDNDPEYTETRFWDWPGQVGILEIRRRRRMERKARGLPDREDGTSSKGPDTEVVLCRLISSIDALQKAFEEPRNQHLLVHNGLPYAVVNAGLEVPLLKQHPTWKATLDDVRNSLLGTDSFDLINTIFEMLDEAWANGTNTFDIESAARSRNLELAIF